MTNLRVMSLSLPLVLCQCAIFLVLFEGAVCSLLDFVIENFSIVDIYSKVEVTNHGQTGQFIFEKSNPADGSQQLPHVVPFSDILLGTLTQEGNHPKVVSFFSAQGQDHKVNYNIKFNKVAQARYFVLYKALPENYKTNWARVYSNLGPVIVDLDYLDDDDVGIKLLDNGDYPNLDEHLYQLPYLFKRSEIENEIKVTPPQTLYLRNKIRAQDYMIVFKSTDNLSTFLKLFPDRVYDEYKTAGYYIMRPWIRNIPK